MTAKPRIIGSRLKEFRKLKHVENEILRCDLQNSENEIRFMTSTRFRRLKKWQTLRNRAIKKRLLT